MNKTRRTPGDGGLYKRGDGLWVASVELPTTDGTRRRKTVSSRDRNETIRKFRKLQSAVAAGELPTSSTTTVDKWLDYWLKSVRGPNLAPATKKFYANTIRLYINPHIGKKRIDRLTPADVRTMLETVKKDSTRNAQKANQVLGTALRDAVKDGLITHNVCDAVKKPKHIAVEGHAFPAEVSMHIMQTAIENFDPWWATRWILGFTTGARESEILGLEWDRVNFTTGMIDIQWQLLRLQKEHGCGDPVDGKYPCGKVRTSYCPGAHWDFDPSLEHRLCERTLVWTRPKSKAGKRLLPLLPDVLARLDNLSRLIGPDPHNLVLRHEDGKPFTQDQDQKKWRHLLELAGVPHVPQHSVRHSTATLLMRAGVPEEIRMLILGQSSIAAHRGYLHADMADVQAAMSNLSAILPPQSVCGSVNIE